mmetsp:Transcript_47042/g.84785  ORF Transcript_47042/g.84785 Transcript_47042/m.84785 type:complete len:142 (+) Transcript_47042:56-481(+)
MADLVDSVLKADALICLLYGLWFAVVAAFGYGEACIPSDRLLPGMPFFLPIWCWLWAYIFYMTTREGPVKLLGLIMGVVWGSLQLVGDPILLAQAAQPCALRVTRIDLMLSAALLAANLWALRVFRTQRNASDNETPLLDS